MVDIDDLENEIDIIIKNYASDYSNGLEVFLRSLLAASLNYKNNKISISEALEMLKKAFKTNPIEFDDIWYSYVQPNGEVNGQDDYLCFEKTIKFQIADLRRLEENGLLKNEHRYFGIKSPTDNIWYNLDVLSYIECGFAGYNDHVRCGNFSVDNFSWSDFAEVLELGRIYE